MEFRISGETLFVFSHPIYLDANGTGDIGKFVLTRQGGNVIVSVRVPLDFLDSAIYPVAIDPTIDLTVGATSDDAKQSASDTVTLDGAVLDTDSPTEHIGARWTSVTVPVGATVDIARVGVQINSGASDEPNHRIRGELDANAPTFTTTSDDIDSRNRTTNSTSWVSTDLGASAEELWEWGGFHSWDRERG